MKFTSVLATILAVAGMALSSVAIAGGNHGPHGHSASVAGLPKEGVDSSTGEVTRIDKDTGKIFIKHGDMKKIGMLAMLMVFDVRDVTMLSQVNVGDTVAFTVERSGGQLTVTKIERTQ